MRLTSLILLSLCLCGCAHHPTGTRATNSLSPPQAKLELLNALPKIRHAALLLAAESLSGDTTPERFEKQRQYIETLQGILKKLDTAYYPDDEPLKGLDDAIELHANELARLEFPDDFLRGASAYEASILMHTIELYENMITTAASGICVQLGEEGTPISYKTWKSQWEKAGKPTAMAPHPK